MPLGTDLRYQVTEFARGAGGTGVDNVNRLALGALHQDGRLRADLYPVTCQCRLTKSGANLSFAPFGMGNLAPVKDADGWFLRQVPSAGISLAATGLTADTLYYIYLYDNAGALTLEAGTTGHSTDSDTGVEIKTADPTRTLVGMARPVTGPAWVDAITQRFVRSWLNDPGFRATDSDTGNRSTSSASYTTIDPGMKIEILVWADELVESILSAAIASGSAGTGVNAGVATDGSVSGSEILMAEGNAITLEGRSVSLGELVEGYHAFEGFFKGTGAVSVSARGDLVPTLLNVLAFGR